MIYEIPEIVLLQNHHLKIEWIKSNKYCSEEIVQVHETLKEDFSISPYQALFQLAFVSDDKKLSQSLENWKKATDLLAEEDIALGDALRMLMSRQGHSFSDILSGDHVEIGIGDWLSVPKGTPFLIFSRVIMLR